MEKLVLIDGNSIMNRAFYGIMGNKMLMTNDGTYTNAVYGFLAIMFKILEDLNPEYLVVTFDLKAPTARHKMYEGYKATRKGMPDELAVQMPIIKNILRAMNITIIEKEGYEADDVIGTLSKKGEKKGLSVTILSGDRDNFQLASDNITIRIPRTIQGKTINEDFDREKIIEKYGLEPKKLIEVKGLMGDTSDNIPGVPGVGEKTALNLVKEYGSIDNLYKALESGKSKLKGRLKERVEQNKELALLSRTLGTINLKVPIKEKIEDFKVQPWDKPLVYELFKELKFNRYIERFDLNNKEVLDNLKDRVKIDIEEISKESDIKKILKQIIKNNEIVYYLETKEDSTGDSRIKQKIESLSIMLDKIYYINIENNKDCLMYFKEIFEDEKIKKIGYKQKKDYILLQENEIDVKGFYFDAEIAAYILNPTYSKYSLDNLANEHLKIDINEYLTSSENDQMNLFETETKEENKKEIGMYAYIIKRLYIDLTKKLEETNQLDLFRNIEMPIVEILANMQYNGVYVSKEELTEYGLQLKEKIDVLIKEIYEISGEEFNINSTKQLGEILFEKLKLPTKKKTKSGYSTDVSVLEKLKGEHPIIEKILDYRQLTKLYSTFVEALKPYINKKTGKIHSYFHQTVTATGRLSSAEPNLQNIPTRIEIGKKLRKVFKPTEGNVFIDADYSQIELRVFAHISNDKKMIGAFNKNEDIHTSTASKVFGVPMNEVTKEQRTHAKAVNFGIVYGISDFGLAEQIGVDKKVAKGYIEQYLEQYSGIKKYMEKIVEDANKNGYVETICHRRRYIPELTSSNYLVRQFGKRAAMNAPIQGTAADIMKIAMINVYKKLKENNMKTKIILQIHDELLLEVPKEELEQAKKYLKESMENAVELKVPLIAEVSEANNWYDCK